MRIEQTPLPSQAVSQLVESVSAHDGTPPINDLGRLALAGRRAMTCLSAIDDGHAVGFALIDPRESSVQLGVDPAHRRRGVGTALADAASEYAPESWWAFGDLPAAAALADTLGLAPVRKLLVMQRSLASVETPQLPDGYRFERYLPSDAGDVVAVNAAAFAHHPEQGNLTITDFNTLTETAWFDPLGLILAKRGEELAGFHWTKSHSAELGEVYVLGVRPADSGHGLGRALLDAGLTYLKDTGHEQVELYVESSEKRVVAMYEAATFEVIHTDTCYARGTDHA